MNKNHTLYPCLNTSTPVFFCTYTVYLCHSHVWLPALLKKNRCKMFLYKLLLCFCTNFYCPSSCILLLFFFFFFFVPIFLWLLWARPVSLINKPQSTLLSLCLLWSWPETALSCLDQYNFVRFMTGPRKPQLISANTITSRGASVARACRLWKHLTFS